MDKAFCLFLAVVAALFETGFCFHCYQCSTRKDTRCDDPITREMTPVECTREAVSNTITEIGHTVRGIGNELGDQFSGTTFGCIQLATTNDNQYRNKSYIRGCYYDKMDGRDPCVLMSSRMIHFDFCKTCNGNACNGSSGLGSSVSILSMLLPIAAAGYFLRQ